VHRTFFDLCCNVEAGREDQERVGLGKRILAVEPLEVDAGGSDCGLTKRDLSSELVDECAEVYVESQNVVEWEMVFRVVRRSFDEALQRGKREEPSIAKQELVKVRFILSVRSSALPDDLPVRGGPEITELKVPSPS